MKIALYSPYIDTLGGGERYMLTFAEYCLQRQWNVELWWKDESFIDAAKKRFNLLLEGLRVNSGLYYGFQEDASYIHKLQKWLRTPSYDLIFWLSDGSIPYLMAKQNWLHFQVPFKLDGNVFWTQTKLTKVQRVICNSQFTKRFIDSSFRLNAEVVYPPVSVHDFIHETPEKENIILSVGRFDQIMNAKRQDILINVFKTMVEKGLNNWRLVLIGGQHHNESELLRLRELSMGYPIDLLVNCGYEELVSNYRKSAIYWHAAGFEVDEVTEPHKVEHFGMSIVEAMAAGCIPIVYKAGGITEIIEDKKSGYFWTSTKQLASITQNIIENLRKEEKIIENARKRALTFSKEAFFSEFDKRLP